MPICNAAPAGGAARFALLWPLPAPLRSAPAGVAVHCTGTSPRGYCMPPVMSEGNTAVWGHACNCPSRALRLVLESLPRPAARPADSSSSELCHAHTCHPARWLWVTAASLPPAASCSSWLIFYQPSSSEWHAQPLTNRRRLNLEALGWCGTYTRPPHWC